MARAPNNARILFLWSNNWAMIAGVAPAMRGWEVVIQIGIPAASAAATMAERFAITSSTE